MKGKLVVAAALAAGMAAPPGSAIVALPPEIVGPPRAVLDSGCPLSFGKAGGVSPGVPIPYPALRIGTGIPRSIIPYFTGGGGTLNNHLEAERSRAGLLPFDPARGAKPAVYFARKDESDGRRLFQRLPIVGAPQGMVFAQATSPSEAQIVALALTLPTRPAAPPTLRVVGGFPSREGCTAQPVHIYSPRMTAAELRRLFNGRGCGWTGTCRARRPRGRVLFVQPAISGRAFEHRWIDYDLLAARG